MADSFPRQYARTQRFTLGEPRNLTVAPDGSRIVFLRSSAGDDGANSLWVKELPSGDERVVADPRALRDAAGGSSGAAITAEERARRERTRDGSTGITSYATDRDCKVAAFALDGKLYTAGLLSGHARHLPIEGPVFDPRPDPTARRLAYVSGRQLRIGELDGSSSVLAGDDPHESESVSWGAAEFIAAEEMQRLRGFWWSPDGTRLAVCRVDTAPVGRWTIADPAAPDTAARTIAYPAAGTDNAAVSVHVLGLDGSTHEIEWDREFFPYVAHVDWTTAGLVLACQSRDQQNSIVVRVGDAELADATLRIVEGEVVASDYDDAWVENVPGLPHVFDGGGVLTHSDDDGTRRLLLDDRPISPPDLQVRSVVGTIGARDDRAPADDDADQRDPDDAGPAIVFVANHVDTPTETHVWITRVNGAAEPLTSAPGIHTAVVGGSTLVVRRVQLDAPGATFTVHDLGSGHDRSNGSDPAGALGDHSEVGTIASLAETPNIAPNVELLRLGERDLATAVLFPTGFDPTDADAERLPVLLDPYGGPHAQRVVANHNAMLASQWFADQGFCVIVADGRGTPGRGSEWERAVRHDLADPPLDDQVDALRAAAEHYECLDLRRVAIRGWSFGGYLAALAVLRRPDVFHAAIAGAPVTEWRLYDTHYTERYLGDPNVTAEVYDANSLLPLAPDLSRPLLLVHGLADDNVVAAHTLQLSSALLAAGRPHEVLPLVGVSHMTPQEVVAEHLLLHQLEFLRRSLPD
ncbi:MAG: prolyl oligopeptidase family serine peptidase [Actinomycetota bacterium]